MRSPRPMAFPRDTQFVPVDEKTPRSFKKSPQNSLHSLCASWRGQPLIASNTRIHVSQMRGRDGKSFVRRTHESRIEGASDGASGT